MDILAKRAIKLPDNLHEFYIFATLIKSSSLFGYSQLIDKLRKYVAQGQSHGKAVDMAIDFCIDHGILYDFLAKHRAEVIKMFDTDYSMKKYRKMVEYNHQRNLPV